MATAQTINFSINSVQGVIGLLIVVGGIGAIYGSLKRSLVYIESDIKEIKSDLVDMKKRLPPVEEKVGILWEERGRLRYRQN